MSLEIHIEKKLPEFSLQVNFTSSGGPLSILGASGAGKTMLLRSIAGLERPDRGRIALNGRVLLDSAAGIDIPARERRIGLLFQDYALFPHRTAEENIAFGLRMFPHEEQRRRAASAMQQMHIAGLGHRYPRELSGGEQQRLALARALATEPEALLLDEPLSALDTHLRSRMEAQLQETFAAFPRPTLLVTHSIEEAYRLGRELLVLSRGRVAAMGAKEEIFRHPPSLEVARLTGCKNFSSARAISENSLDAADWGCRLRIAGSFDKPPAHVGIRAHHIEFVESSHADANENILPCWLARTSETPFRITLYLRLKNDPNAAEASLLQAEVLKRDWEKFRGRPFPWHVRLAPDSLLLLPE